MFMVADGITAIGNDDIITGKGLLRWLKVRLSGLMHKKVLVL